MALKVKEANRAFKRGTGNSYFDRASFGSE